VLVLGSMMLTLDYQLIFPTLMCESYYTDLDLEPHDLPKVYRVRQWLTRKSFFLSFINWISLLIDLIVPYPKHGLNQCVLGLVEGIHLSFHIG